MRSAESAIWQGVLAAPQQCPVKVHALLYLVITQTVVRYLYINPRIKLVNNRRQNSSTMVCSLCDVFLTCLSPQMVTFATHVQKIYACYLCPAALPASVHKDWYFTRDVV